jgi:hypothetical protein
MTKDEALRLALEALEWQQEMLYTAMQYSAAKGMTFLGHPPNPNEAITAIKAALEAPEEKYIYGTPLLDAMTKDYVPPQRTWVGLTDEEVTWLCNTAKSHEQTWGMFVRAIETKLKEKNT